MTGAPQQPSTHAAINAAWQQVLATEHAAIFGYAVLGPYLLDAAQIAQAHTFEQAHREQRDALASQLANAGVTPASAAPFYSPPHRIADAVGAQQWALHVEQACAASYRYVLLASVAVGTLARAERVDTASRTQAVAGLTTSALAAASWRSIVTPAAATVPFPGS